MTERTLVLIKPDGVQRLLVGRILERYESRGLKLVGLKLVQVDRALAERHYAVHRERPFFGSLVDFIISARSSRSPSRGPTRSPSSARSTGRPGRTRRRRARSGATSRSRRPRTSSTRPISPRPRPPSSRCGSSPASCTTTTGTSIAGCSPRRSSGPVAPQGGRRTRVGAAGRHERSGAGVGRAGLRGRTPATRLGDAGEPERAGRRGATRRWRGRRARARLATRSMALAERGSGRPAPRRGGPPVSPGPGPLGPDRISGRSLPPLTTGAGSTAASGTPTNPNRRSRP